MRHDPFADDDATGSYSSLRNGRRHAEWQSTSYGRHRCCCHCFYAGLCAALARACDAAQPSAAAAVGGSGRSGRLHSRRRLCDGVRICWATGLLGAARAPPTGCAAARRGPGRAVGSSIRGEHRRAGGCDVPGVAGCRLARLLHPPQSRDGRSPVRACELLCSFPSRFRARGSNNKDYCNLYKQEDVEEGTIVIKARLLSSARVTIISN